MKINSLTKLCVPTLILLSDPSFAAPNNAPEIDPLQRRDIQREETVKLPSLVGIEPSIWGGGNIQDTNDAGVKKSSIFAAMLDSLETMQSHYFQLWQGTWPSSIDWTAAVFGTYLSATLTSLTLSIDQLRGTDCETSKCAENVINTYFSQLVSFYFGQDAFGLRTQAYDDMLWVVLGWLESIKFVELHSIIHYQGEKSYWYGTEFIPAFAHRARVFYDLASRGWDTDLCGGGMIWSPYLRPYKNAITNELFITASISMYLYFPGDENSSPFQSAEAGIPPASPHDRKHLDAAINAYQWLSSSNMTNSKGLYVDGFHIRRSREPVVNKRCDDRNEMVYTYNQGVLLSGLRGLWEATGSTQYLDDAQNLIRSVITSTGWDFESGLPDDDGCWAGLGRDGVLEELCDAGGYCSQNGQTFKGIFFHHLTAFCAPLPSFSLHGNHSFAADIATINAHNDLCNSYRSWIIHNARAAYQTRDDDGNYGMWWGKHEYAAITPIPPRGVDFQNRGFTQVQPDVEAHHSRHDALKQINIGNKQLDDKALSRDVNDRGRGRTVETQGGGLSVLRALWELT